VWVAKSDATDPEMRMGNVSISIGTPALSPRNDPLAHDANVSFPHAPPPNSGKEISQRRHKITTALAILEINAIVADILFDP
jgi:hypothetical protein